MGETISRKAAAANILADVATTLRLARVRGGVFATEAERLLADILDQAARASSALEQAEAALQAARDVSDLRVREARLAVGAAYDTLWNALGRPAFDTRLRLWFPDAGSSADGAVATVAVRMRVIAGVMRAEPHPVLDRALCLTLADRIHDAAEALHVAQQALVEPEGHVTYYRQLVQAVARGAHVQLATYKRALLVHGYRQVQIHEVIPAHPGRRAAPVAIALPAVQAPNAELPADVPAEPEVPELATAAEVPDEPGVAPEPALDPAARRRTLSVVPPAGTTRAA